MAPLEIRLPAQTHSDRVLRLESTVSTLLVSFQQLQVDLCKHVAEAVRATLAAQAPTAAKKLASAPAPSPGHSFRPKTSPQTSDDIPVDASPPPWGQKSDARAMVFLGTIYEYLLRTGAAKLAGDLEVDYIFLPPPQGGQGTRMSM